MEAISSTVEKALEALRLAPAPHPTLVQPDPREIQELREKYAQYAQEHVFSFWGDLKPEQQAQLYHQLASIDPTRVQTIAETVFGTKDEEAQGEISPPPQSAVASTFDASADELSKWRDAGLKAIAEGKVAVLLMAGGQGTRLGSSAPKGCYDIGLPSKKSLFQLQAERLLKLQQLAAESHGDREKEVIIPWYIMTSGPTRKDTEDFLKSKKYFGLKVLHHLIALTSSPRMSSSSSKVSFPVSPMKAKSSWKTRTKSQLPQTAMEAFISPFSLRLSSQICKIATLNISMLTASITVSSESPIQSSSVIARSEISISQLKSFENAVQMNPSVSSY